MAIRRTLDGITEWNSAVSEIGDNLSQAIQMTLNYVMESQLVKFKSSNPIKEFGWAISAEGHRNDGFPGITAF